MSHQSSWSHYVELLVLDDINIINYYITEIINKNLSVRELRSRVKSKEYERLPNATKSKIINNEIIKIEDNIKNPIIIRNNSNEIISEKILQKLILEDIMGFMKELGEGYSFISKLN